MSAAPLAKRLRRTFRVFALRVTLRLIAALPLRTAARLGELCGELAFRFFRAERDKALTSTAIAFPEWSPEHRGALVRGCFRHLGRCAFELACARKLDAALGDLVVWPAESKKAFDAALAKGKGIVFVSGHVGNWELLARTVARAGYPVQSIAKEASDPRLTALVEQLRGGGGVKSIWRGQPGAAKQMLRTLKTGQALGLLIDQDTRVQSVFVPFFGRPAATPRAAADLALRTGAAVMVGFCRRRTDGRYELSMLELPVPRTADPEADVLALTARLTQEIERAIRGAPEQWVWMHQRWKTQPC